MVNKEGRMVMEMASRRARRTTAGVAPSTKKAVKIKKGRWAEHEDELLLRLVRQQLAAGVKSDQLNWDEVEEGFKTRSKKQCRERWISQLDPTLKKTEWTKEEEALLLRLAESLNNKWAEIARRIHGRTENNVKNKWHALQRQRENDPNRRKRKSSSQNGRQEKLVKSVSPVVPALKAESNHNTKENACSTRALQEELNMVYPLSCISNKGLKTEKNGIEKQGSLTERMEDENIPRGMSLDLMRLSSMNERFAMKLARGESNDVSVFEGKDETMQRQSSFDLAADKSWNIETDLVPIPFPDEPLTERQASFGVSQWSESDINSLFYEENKMEELPPPISALPSW